MLSVSANNCQGQLCSHIHVGTHSSESNGERRTGGSWGLTFHLIICLRCLSTLMVIAAHHWGWQGNSNPSLYCDMSLLLLSVTIHVVSSASLLSYLMDNILHNLQHLSTCLLKWSPLSWCFWNKDVLYFKKTEWCQLQFGVVESWTECHPHTYKKKSWESSYLFSNPSENWGYKANNQPGHWLSRLPASWWQHLLTTCSPGVSYLTFPFVSKTGRIALLW